MSALVAAIAALLSAPAPTSAPAPVGVPAPEIALPDASGVTRRLSELRGRPLLVHFWASWCAPCRTELPLLNAMADRLGDAAAVVTVNLDAQRGPAGAAIKRLALTMPVWFDPGGVAAAAWSPQGMPASWVVDAQGVVRERQDGAYAEDQIGPLEARLRSLGEGR